MSNNNCSEIKLCYSHTFHLLHFIYSYLNLIHIFVKKLTLLDPLSSFYVKRFARFSGIDVEEVTN